MNKKVCSSTEISRWLNRWLLTLIGLKEVRDLPHRTVLVFVLVGLRLARSTSPSWSRWRVDRLRPAGCWPWEYRYSTTSKRRGVATRCHCTRTATCPPCSVSRIQDWIVFVYSNVRSMFYKSYFQNPRAILMVP